MSEFDYKDLYEASPIGLWRTNIEDGKFIHANEAAVHILGFANFAELSHCVSKDLYDPAIRKQLVNKLKIESEINDFYVVMKRKDEQEITVVLSAKINLSKGYIEGTIRDVTGVINMEEAKLIPHLEKISSLREHILEKIKQNDACLYKHAKIA
jgi:PAS domain-containing protein